jgi:uncharacterized phage-associated protein
MKAPFSLEKAAQAAHFFIRKQGGEMDVLKLVKLLYLADRESFEQRRIHIIGGRYFSMPHGPVTSEVLNILNAGTPDEDSVWERLISDRADHRVAARVPEVDYDELAASELRVLNHVWETFGHMTKWQLRDWTHQHCEEWSDPSGSRIEISARQLAQCFAWSESEISEFELELEAQNRLEAVFA